LVLPTVDSWKQNKPQLGYLDSMEHLEAKKRSGVQGLQKRGADSVLELEGFVPAVVFSGRKLSEAPHSCAKSNCVISFEISLYPLQPRL
jgi:hypothetical protein